MEPKSDNILLLEVGRYISGLDAICLNPPGSLSTMLVRMPNVLAHQDIINIAGRDARRSDPLLLQKVLASVSPARPTDASSLHPPKDSPHPTHLKRRPHLAYLKTLPRPTHLHTQTQRTELKKLSSRSHKDAASPRALEEAAYLLCT